MMKLSGNQKLVFIGDSITDTGRARPIGEKPFGGLGNGYVSLVDALLSAVYPQLRIRVVNVGISGNRVRDLAERWQSDVLDQKPDWLSIMIGTNDVWRQFDSPAITESHVYEQEYAETYNRLLEQTRPQLQGLVLMTPFYLSLDMNDPMRKRMDEYGRIVRELAAKHDAIFVDTQAAYDQLMHHVHSYELSGDRIHPNTAGHMVLAKAFLDAVGFSWDGR
jgi:Lysophospholipase L1 and related esterases